MTLLETLAVLLVVSLLSSLMLSAVSKARGHANALRCMASLRHLGLAFELYAHENGESLPYPDRNFSGLSSAEDRTFCWFNALDPHLLGLKAARSNSVENLHLAKQDPVIQRLGTNWVADAHTLKMNQRLGEDAGGGRQFYRFSDLRHPDRTVLLFDGRAETEKLADGGPAAMAKNPSGTEGLVARRHQERANVLFVDGHVELRWEKPQTSGSRLGWELDGTSLLWKPWKEPPVPK